MAASLMQAMKAVPQVTVGQAGPWEVVEYLTENGILTEGPAKHAIALLFITPGVRSVQTWVNHCSTSRRTLVRWMERAGLPSPTRWVQFVGQVRAIRLMQRTGCTAMRAAYALGYPDPFTLSHQMHRVLGMRPGEARHLPDVKAVLELWLMREREAGHLRPRRAPSLPIHQCPVCGQSMEAS